MAVSETPRLIVLNQCQMLSPFYAINIHCRAKRQSLLEMKQRIKTVICSAVLGLEVKNLSLLFNMK